MKSYFMITTAGKEINELVNAYYWLRDRPFNAPPVIVNYFYHNPKKKTAKNRPRIYKNARSRTLRPRAR